MQLPINLSTKIKQNQEERNRFYLAIELKKLQYKRTNCKITSFVCSYCILDPISEYERTVVAEEFFLGISYILFRHGTILFFSFLV